MAMPASASIWMPLTMDPQALRGLKLQSNRPLNTSMFAYTIVPGYFRNSLTRFIIKKRMAVCLTLPYLKPQCGHESQDLRALFITHSLSHMLPSFTSDCINNLLSKQRQTQVHSDPIISSMTFSFVNDQVLGPSLDSVQVRIKRPRVDWFHLEGKELCNRQRLECPSIMYISLHWLTTHSYRINMSPSWPHPIIAAMKFHNAEFAIATYGTCRHYQYKYSRHFARSQTQDFSPPRHRYQSLPSPTHQNDGTGPR